MTAPPRPSPRAAHAPMDVEAGARPAAGALTAAEVEKMGLPPRSRSKQGLSTRAQKPPWLLLARRPGRLRQGPYATVAATARPLVPC